MRPAGNNCPSFKSAERLGGPFPGRKCAASAVEACAPDLPRFLFTTVHHVEMVSLSPKRLSQSLHLPGGRVVAVTCGILSLRSEQILSALRRRSMIRNRQLPSPMINSGDANFGHAPYSIVQFGNLSENKSTATTWRVVVYSRLDSCLRQIDAAGQ